jgi:hypothetical protein
MRASVVVAGMAGFVLLNCASDDDAAPKGNAGKEVPQTLEDSCARWCALTEAFAHPCEPGKMLYHGVDLDADPPAEAPVSTDRACIDSCTRLSPRALCWQANVDQMDCDVEAIWICDESGGFGTNDCHDSGGAEVCEGKYARPEAWQQSDEWTAACQRYCGLAEALVPDCSPGDTSIRGVPLGSDPPSTAPISTDQACMERCLLPNSLFECAGQLIARSNCFAEALWVCKVADVEEDGEGGGYWHTDECEAENRGIPGVCE